MLKRITVGFEDSWDKMGVKPVLIQAEVLVRVMAVYKDCSTISIVGDEHHSSGI